MSDPTRHALRNLERVLARDPLLRDVLEQTVPKARRSGRFLPDVDVLEHEQSYVLLIDLPGLSREEVEVELEGQRLVVTGARDADHPGGYERKTTERSFGPFRRVFLLPSNADGGGVRARMANGVLRIDVPRIGEEQHKKVPIE